MLEAEVLFSEEGYGPELSIHGAVTEALLNNLLYRIREEEIQTAESDHRIFWSDYLPQAEFQLIYDWRDSDTARRSASRRRGGQR